MIAVTAASGRLGRALLRHLVDLAGADSIVAIARDPARVEQPGIVRRAGDYESLESMVSAFQGIDTAVMISAPVTMHNDRAAMHRRVIAAARQAGVRKLVYTSVIGSSDVAGTMYADTQQVSRATEADIAASGLQWVIARNALYLELDLGHIVRARTSGVYSNAGGQGRCGYLSIDELAWAIARLATDEGNNGQVLNLIGERTYTQAELVAQANEVFGLQVRYQPILAEANVARFMRDPGIAARGEVIARMLTGCFECIARGTFDVSSDYERAAGRPPKSLREQMEILRGQMQAIA